MKRLIIITLCFCCAFAASAQKKTSTQSRTNRSTTVRKQASTQQKKTSSARSGSTLTLTQVGKAFEKLPFAYMVEDQCGILNQLKGYEWTVKSPREKKIEMFPKKVDYLYYPSHPEYRLIGDKLYDDKGNLKAVLLMYTWGHASMGDYLRSDYDDVLKDGDDERNNMVKELAISAYMNNAYDVKTQTTDNVQYMIEQELEMYEYDGDWWRECSDEEKQQVHNYCGQIKSESEQKVWKILKVERVDSTSFNVHYATKDKKPSIVVKYTFYSDGPYKVRYEHSFDGMYKASDDIVEQPDVQPSFTSGALDLNEYLIRDEVLSNAVALAEQKGIKGQVIVQFVVLANGKTADVKIEKSLDESIDRKVLEVVKEMPKWKPGRKGIRPVNVRCRMPITFK